METMYYYCNSKVFDSIIRKKEIWLSDMMRSNDYAEIIGFTESLFPHFKIALHSLKRHFKDNKYDFTKIYNKATWIFIKEIQSRIKHLFCLAICFTNRRDDLSQWRAYGDNGSGYLIGFNKENLEEIAIKHKLTHFREIEYSSDKKEAYIKDEMSKFAQQLRLITGRKGKKMGYFFSNLTPKIKDVVANLIDEAPYYKSEGFSAECETRLAYVRYIYANQFDNLEADSYLNNFDCKITTNDIVPYLKINISDYPDIFNEVIIGPCNKADDKALEIYLAAKHIKVNRICKSVITFRAK